MERTDCNVGPWTLSWRRKGRDEMGMAEFKTLFNRVCVNSIYLLLQTRNTTSRRTAATAMRMIGTRTPATITPVLPPPPSLLFPTFLSPVPGTVGTGVPPV